MNINGVNTLILEKRGCDFYRDEYKNYSDIGNHRVGVYDYTVAGKDGRNYIVEFTMNDHRVYRTTNKRTGAPLKHGKVDIVKRNALYLDTQYEEIKPGEKWAGCYRNLEIEKNIYNMHLDFTKAGILEAVNTISKDKYKDIKICTVLKIELPIDKNFTPAGLMIDYAKRNYKKIEHNLDETIYINGFGTKHKFLCYQIEKKETTKIVTLYLEQIEA